MKPFVRYIRQRCRTERILDRLFSGPGQNYSPGLLFRRSLSVDGHKGVMENRVRDAFSSGRRAQDDREASDGVYISSASWQKESDPTQTLILTRAEFPRPLKKRPLAVATGKEANLSVDEYAKRREPASLQTALKGTSVAVTNRK